MKAHEKPLVDSAARGRARSDLETSLCVEAGAGTGKTSLLVDRFLAIVMSGKASCGQIVAITFTEKAAGEMKVRLRARIMDRLAEPGDPARARENLDAALDELERAPISTIHSFAATILREHPVEAGVDPNFTQLDALESELFFDECWNDFLLRGAGEWGATLRRFISLGGSIADLRSIVDTFSANRAERCCGHIFGAQTGAGAGGVRAAADADESQATADAGEGASPASLRGSFAAAAGRLSTLARDHCVNPDDLGGKAIEGFLAGLEALDLLRDDDLEYFLLTLLVPKGTKGSKGNWRPAEACAEQKAVFKELGELQARERERVSDELRGRLERFSAAFLAFVERRKAEAGILDFDDLLIKTRMLCNDPDALDGLRERYRFILVDEFQDTDPVQAEIVYLLSGAPGRRGDAEPEPGKLFIVGDPKQSIYRFRRADIEIYELVKERVTARGERLAITQNFRSVPGIVDWVNETFSEIMQPSDKGRFQPPYEGIHAFRTGEGRPVVCLDLELAPEDSNAGGVRRVEGEAIARVVHRLVEGGMTVRDPANGQTRPLGYGDIAVIYPGTTGIDYYEEPLRAESIPYIVEGGKLYYTREEVRDLASAVWSIEDPYDRLALLAALRSPIFGASDEELFLFKRAGGKLDYLDPGAEALGQFPGLAEAFSILSELHLKRNDLGPSGVILDLLRRTKYLELSLLRPHGDQRVSNVRKAISSARDFEAKFQSFRRFARWFRDQETLASSEGESPIVEEQSQAVRLLTVHKAKGLQFPVVILANLIQSKRSSSRLLVEGGSRLAFKLGLLETSDYAELLERERARDAAETVRLLYVAATRAGDLLVIPDTPKANTYFDLIRRHLCVDGARALDEGAQRDADRGDLVPVELKPEETDSIDSPNVALWRRSDLPPLRGQSRPFVRFKEATLGEARRAAEEREKWVAERAALIARARRASLTLAPSTFAAAAHGEAAVSGEISAPGDARAGEGVQGGHAGEGASRFEGAGGIEARGRSLLLGEAFHRIMELADLSHARPPDGLVASVAADLGIPEDAPELGRLAETALGSELIKRAARAPRVYREVPFSVPAKCAYVEGRIDLLFEDEGGWTLVDYKTDDVPAEIPAARIEAYRRQAGIYALALRSFSIECRGWVALYFARPGVVKLIDLTSELLAEAEKLVEEAVLKGGAS
jgi:ATP-dependent helicase/nuclease subunit A